jgi:hypothetical protein
MLLAGDIGGTKTALGVFSEERGPHTALAESEVHCADHTSLESIAKEFLAKTEMKVNRGCFGVAGPVLRPRTYKVPRKTCAAAPKAGLSRRLRFHARVDMPSHARGLRAVGHRCYPRPKCQHRRLCQAR